MACSTGRCALRRFDGHGTSSYRPTNPEMAREFQSRMDQLLADRSRQDQGVFTVQPVQTPSVQPVQAPSVQPAQAPSVQPVQAPSVQPMQMPNIQSSHITSSTIPKYYSLSDSK